MIAILFEVTTPVFLVIAVGVVIGRVFKPEVTVLSGIALYAAVPALVFSSLSTSDVAFEDAGLLLASNALFLAGMGLLALLVTRRLPPGTRRGLLATSLFGNAANIMLPITLFAFGDAGLQRALILYVFSAVMLFTLGPMVLGGRRDEGRVRFLLTVLRLPVLWAALAAVAVNALGIPVPVGIGRGVALLGQAAIPIVLLTLGFQIERTGFRLPSAASLTGAGLKLIGGPVVGYAAALALGARGLDLAVLTLLAAMPPAINTFMLALEFGADGDEVAATVIVSTLLSVVTITVVLVLLARLGVAG
jgi:malate permease and related proteins